MFQSFTYDGLMSSPALQDPRHFLCLETVFDTRFLLCSQWMVDTIGYQTDGNGEQDEMGELEANKSMSVFSSELEFTVPRKVGTRKVIPRYQTNGEEKIGVVVVV